MVRGSPGRNCWKTCRPAAEFAAIAEEQHPAHPPGPDECLAERDGDACLAGARGLDDQRPPVPFAKSLDDALDRLDLVHAVRDLRIRRNFLGRAYGSCAGRLGTRGCPVSDSRRSVAAARSSASFQMHHVVSVRVVDDGPAAVHLLEAVRVALGLLTRPSRRSRRSSWLRRLPEGCRRAEQDVVSKALSRLGRLVLDRFLDPDELRIVGHVPAGFLEHGCR
jgi:hypothetical protein